VLGLIAVFFYGNNVGNENTVYWTLSTMSQGFLTLSGLIIVVTVFHKESINNSKEKIRESFIEAAEYSHISEFDILDDKKFLRDMREIIEKYKKQGKKDHIINKLTYYYTTFQALDKREKDVMEGHFKTFLILVVLGLGSLYLLSAHDIPIINRNIHLFHYLFMGFSLPAIILLLYNLYSEVYKK
jgi:hypothetical protein